MTSGAELVEGICLLLEKPGPAIPVTLMNQTAGQALEIIVAVIERSALKGISIAQVAIDPELAAKSALQDGDQPSAKVPTTVRVEQGLGRQVVFRRGTS